eukprot:2221923-Amphidinium_carterae.1
MAGASLDMSKQLNAWTFELRETTMSSHHSALQDVGMRDSWQQWKSWESFMRKPRSISASSFSSQRNAN